MKKHSKWMALVGLGLLAGCDGQAVYIGNLAVTTIPCVMLYLTLNYKKDH